MYPSLVREIGMALLAASVVRLTYTLLQHAAGRSHAPPSSSSSSSTFTTTTTTATASAPAGPRVTLPCGAVVELPGPSAAGPGPALSGPDLQRLVEPVRLGCLELLGESGGGLPGASCPRLAGAARGGALVEMCRVLGRGLAEGGEGRSEVPARAAEDFDGAERAER